MILCRLHSSDDPAKLLHAALSKFTARSSPDSVAREIARHQSRNNVEFQAVLEILEQLNLDPETITAAWQFIDDEADEARRFFRTTETSDGTDFIVDRLVFSRRPAVIGGPAKACKTLLGLAMASAIARGEPFLGHTVPRPRKCLYFCGESSRNEMSAWIERAGGFGAGIELFDRLHTLGRSNVQKIVRIIEGSTAEVVFLDPLVHCLGSIDATSLCRVTARLRAINGAIAGAGATAIFVHHSQRSLSVGEPMELSHLVGAGVPEFARSWFLVNRLKAFDPADPGMHELVTTTGTCQGDAARLKLRISEKPWSLTFEPFVKARKAKR
jgi:hypothetical protein